MKFRITACLLAVLLTASLIACGGDDAADPSATGTAGVTENGSPTETVIQDTEDETTGEIIQNIRPVHPEAGATVRLQNKTVWDFCNGYTAQSTNRLSAFSGEDEYAPESLTLSFACAEAADYYRVSVSRKADLSEAETYLVGTPELVLENLYTGTTYFWQVDAITPDRTYRSAVYSFTTAAGPRTILVDGLSNTRDAGGMEGLDGYRIKQGMIYRGGQMDNPGIHQVNITAEGMDFMVNVLGIKTDLDLRTPGKETAGKSPLGANVRYFNFDGCYYVEPHGFGHGIDTAANMAIMAEELRVFTDPANYPVYIHCSLGRDRTGTLVMLLQGLSGASKDAMALDYELSCLSAYGSMGDPDEEFFPRCFNSIYTYIDKTYQGKTFAEKVENYMLRIGLSAEEIASIRTILLEEVN